jgi:hypothetical protein
VLILRPKPFMLQRGASLLAQKTEGYLRGILIPVPILTALNTWKNVKVKRGSITQTP